MNTLKIFLNSTLRSIWPRPAIRDEEPNLLDHPDIHAMDLRQLADLPMPYLPAGMAVDAEAQPEAIPLARCA